MKAIITILIISTVIFSNTPESSTPINLKNGFIKYIIDYTYEAKPNQTKIEIRKFVLKKLIKNALIKLETMDKTVEILKVTILSQKWTNKKTFFWSEAKKTMHMSVAIFVRDKKTKIKIKQLVDYKRVISKLKQGENEHTKAFKKNIKTIQDISIYGDKEKIIQTVRRIKTAYKRIKERKKEANTRPDKPSNFLINNIAENNMSISWSPSKDTEGGVEGYYVSYKTNIHYTKSIFTKEPKLTLSNLKPNTGYNIRIRAIDDENTYSKYLESWAFQPALKPLDDKGTKFAEVIRTFRGHRFWVNAIATTPNGKYVLSGGGDNIIKLWDINTGKFIRTFRGHRLWVNSITTTRDGKYVLSGSSDRTLRMWDIETGKMVKMFEGHKSYIMSIATTTDGKYILSGSWDTTLKLWDIEEGKLVRTFRGHTDYVLAVAITTDGKYAVSGSEDKTLKLWDMHTGKLIRTFIGHTDYIHSVTITPNGKYALSASEDKTLKLWEIKTGKLVRTFVGHKKTIYSVNTTPDGKYVLSGSHDKTIKLWDIKTGELIKTLKGHKRAITSTAIIPNGKYAVSGSWDNNLKLWNISQ